MKFAAFLWSLIVQALRINNREFREIAALVYQLTGIQLKEQKKSLLVARLSSRLKTLRLPGFDAYLGYINDVANRDKEIPYLINSITTNTTEFFRESGQFAFLESLLPRLIEEGERIGNKRLRVWCSACSTGEEAYSLAMVLACFFKDKEAWNVRVLASDIDTDVLAAASAGIYSIERARAVPHRYRRPFLVRRKDLPPGYVAVSSRLRNMVVFRKVNLLADSFRFRTPIDIIFCRNVVIYFDEDGKRLLVEKFHDVLREGGYIFVGHSESLLLQRERFQFVESTIYRRNG